jgi:hypothetical protein
MDVDYTKMKSETMSVLSNPTIISYSLIFCSTLILGYYTLHDSQAFKPSEESRESKSLFSSSDSPAKEETAPEPAPASSTNFFGGPEKKDEPAPSTNMFGGPEKEEEKPAPPSTNIFGSPGKEEENPPPSTNTFGGPEKEEEKPAEAKPIGTGGKRSRNRNKKNAKKAKKSKKNHKL